MKKWEIPPAFKENWSGVDERYYEIVLSQGEKILAEIVRAGEGITDKAYKILGVAITVVTGCFIYLFTVDQSNITLVIASIIASVQSIAAIILLYFPINFYNAFVSGSSPKSLLVSEMINGIDKNLQVKNLLLSECINYQERIDGNIQMNLKRLEKVRIALYLLALIPLSLIAGWGITLFYFQTFNN